MNQVQSKLLNMLLWYHEFCLKHQLTYFAIGGTLLGAVRHQGYIPWDDDIDIGMPRTEYNRFIELMRQSKNDIYMLEIPGEHKDFVYSFCKLYDTTTTLIEHTRYKTKRGIYLDIFPLDGIGNTLEESKKNFQRINYLNNLISTKTCAISPHRSFLKNTTIVLSRCIPNFILNWRKIVKKVNDLCCSRQYEDCDYVGNLLGNWRERELVRKEWLGIPVLKQFENIQIFCPENAHAYLTNIYGDYMVLPPQEKRQSHHDYLCLDLQRSYLNSEV